MGLWGLYCLLHFDSSLLTQNIDILILFEQVFENSGPRLVEGEVKQRALQLRKKVTEDTRSTFTKHAPIESNTHMKSDCPRVDDAPGILLW